MRITVNSHALNLAWIGCVEEDTRIMQRVCSFRLRISQVSELSMSSSRPVIYAMLLGVERGATPPRPIPPTTTEVAQCDPQYAHVLGMGCQRRSELDLRAPRVAWRVVRIWVDVDGNRHLRIHRNDQRNIPGQLRMPYSHSIVGVMGNNCGGNWDGSMHIACEEVLLLLRAFPSQAVATDITCTKSQQQGCPVQHIGCSRY